MEVEREEDAAHGLASEGLILICYIHGFKGNDETFEQFPKRILYSLSQTFGAKMHIDSVIYPAYRTAGKLEDAVVLFKEWLVALTAEKEEAFMLAQQKETVRGGNAAATWQDRTQAKVVLMGHSMGGLVAADTVLSIRAEYEAAKIGLWPRIVGVLAFDTPYLGLNPRTFSNTADQYIDHATKAHDTIRDLTGFSLGSIWGPAGKGAEQRSSDALTRKEDTASTSSWWSAKTAGALGGTAFVSLLSLCVAAYTLTKTIPFLSLAAAAAGLAWSQRSAISSLGVNSWDFVNSVCMPSVSTGHPLTRAFVMISILNSLALCGRRKICNGD